jgi:hypothetical protein
MQMLKYYFQYLYEIIETKYSFSIDWKHFSYVKKKEEEEEERILSHLCFILNIEFLSPIRQGFMHTQMGPPNREII